MEPYEPAFRICSSVREDSLTGRRNPKVSRGRFVRPGSVGTSGQAERRSRWTAGQHSCTGGGLRRAWRKTVAGVNGYPLYGRERPDRACGLPRARPCTHASQKSPSALTRRPYQNRHRWEGTNIPRRARETSLRNSAKWPRNFGRRGPPGQCPEAQ